MLVFVSYSHLDAEWKDLLMPHLQVAFYGSEFEAWDDEKIRAGQKYEGKILEAVERADAALLLVSAESLTSKYILEKEVPRLLERHQKHGIPIVPVILKPCPWKRVDWLAEMEVRPKKGDLSSLSAAARDATLAEIASELADMLTGPPEAPQPAAEPAPNADPASQTEGSPPDFLAGWRPSMSTPAASSPESTPASASLAAPLIYHNVMRNNINGMEIVVPGTVQAAQGRSAQLAVHFFGPNGQQLYANPQESFYRDLGGAVSTYSASFTVPGPSYDLSMIRLGIPYYALNLIPTGGTMMYALSAVGGLYLDGQPAARSQPTALSVWW